MTLDTGPTSRAKTTHVVTLVHGTWAQDAPWVQSGSKLSRALETALENVILASFPWSGKNSHKARLADSIRLRRQLIAQADAYPGAAQFVVAHSHGGNVAMYALKDSQVRQSVRGVVCLSTPFIHARHRGLGSLTPVIAFLFFSLAALVYFGLSWLFPGATLRNSRIFAVGYFALLAGFLALKPVARRIDERVISLFTALQQPLLAPDDLLVIRAAGDEASAALGASYLASWIADLGYRYVNSINGAGRALQKRLFALGMRGKLLVILVGGLCAVTLQIVAGQTTDPSHRVALVWLSLGCLMLAGVFSWPFVVKWVLEVVEALTGGPLLVASLLIALATTPFGGDTIVAGLFMEVSGEITPPGHFTVVQLPDIETNDLWHSVPYEHPAAIRAIIKWMASRNVS